jgi:hypothetical protein
MATVLLPVVGSFPEIGLRRKQASLFCCEGEHGSLFCFERESGMKRFNSLAFAVSALIALFLSVQPAIAQGTIVSVSKVYYQPRTDGGARQPPTVTGGRFVVFQHYFYPVEPNLPGDQYGYTPDGAPSYTLPSGTYELAFVNITGGYQGAITVFPPFNVPQPQVALRLLDPAKTIFAAYVYFPVRVSGPPCPARCPTAAYIDEYNEDKWALLDDTFVSVFTPPTSTVAAPGPTTSGNTLGLVNTTEESVRINAQNTPSADPQNPQYQLPGIFFDRWVSGPGGTVGSNSHDLSVGKQTSNYALALYHDPCAKGYVWNPNSKISQCTGGVVPKSCPTGQVYMPYPKPGVCRTLCTGGTIGLVPNCHCTKINSATGECV